MLPGLMVHDDVAWNRPQFLSHLAHELDQHGDEANAYKQGGF